jgi:hypothetical protein
MDHRGHYGSTLGIGGGAVLLLGIPHGLIATAIMLPFCRLPDRLDSFIDEKYRHRHPLTHSIFPSLAIGYVVASSVAFVAYLLETYSMAFRQLAVFYVSPLYVWLFVGGSVTVSLFGHVLTDMLTTGGGFPVNSLWPVHSKLMAAKICNYDNEWWNGALFGAGFTAFVAAIAHRLYLLI